MREIACEELESILKNQSSAFLCGNGFSMNFDKDFSNIYDRLYQAHKSVIRNGKYKIKSKNTVFKKVFVDNYNSIVSFLRNMKEEYIEKIFTDGICFAESILKSEELLRELEEKELIQELIFGKKDIDLVNAIYKIGSTKGYTYVNIEYWTILIYFYFLIVKIESSFYEFPKDNEFIFLIKLGFHNKNKIIEDKNDITQYVLSNGFNIYYRMLFSTVILSKGKAIKFSLLENTCNLKIDTIKQFLNYFQICLTLNYDWILEGLCKNTVHLHGRYRDKEEYVWCQSLGILFDNEEYVSFSDILIGDYFINKIKAGLINSLDKADINKKVYTPNKIIEGAVIKLKIDVFVIFGMCIDNDQHIIRSIMVELTNHNKGKVKIIYCYFSDEDKNTFDEQYNISNTFSEDLRNKVKQIELLYIKTPVLLNKYFYNK